METSMKEYLNLVMIHLSLTPYEGLVFNKEAEFIGTSFKDHGVTIRHNVQYIKITLTISPNMMGKVLYFPQAMF